MSRFGPAAGAHPDEENSSESSSSCGPTAGTLSGEDNCSESSGSCGECKLSSPLLGETGSSVSCGPCADECTTTDDLPEGNSNLYYLDTRVVSLLESPAEINANLLTISVENDVTVGGNIDVSGHIRCQSVTTVSDGRLKQNVRQLDNDSAISRLRPCLFEYRSQPKRTHAGFIAQELEEVMPHTVHQGGDGYKSISISEIVPYLVREVQSLRSEITELKGKRC